MKPHTAAEALAWMAANPGRVMIWKNDSKFRIYHGTREMWLEYWDHKDKQWRQVDSLPLGDYREEEGPKSELLQAIDELTIQVVDLHDGNEGAVGKALSRYTNALLAEVRRIVDERTIQTGLSPIDALLNLGIS